jgi:hypothetical protein
MQTDTLFAGPVPQLYDRHLGPFMFEPYAEVLARRLSGPSATSSRRPRAPASSPARCWPRRRRRW